MGSNYIIVCSGRCGKTTEGMTYETKTGRFTQVDESGIPDWLCDSCRITRLEKILTNLLANNHNLVGGKIWAEESIKYLGGL